MVAKVSKSVLILSISCLSACQHYCLTYADMQDCDTRLKVLRQEIAELTKENRKLRLYSSYNKCEDATTYHH